MFDMPASRQRHVCSSLPFPRPSLLRKSHYLRSLLPLFGMSSRQPSILLEVASERHLHDWLFMPLPCYGSGLAEQSRIPVGKAGTIERNTISSLT